MFAAPPKDLRCPSSYSDILLVPAREGLRWEYRRFPTQIVDNPLAGPPREASEHAWHDLLKSEPSGPSYDKISTNHQILIGDDNIRVPVTYLKEKNLTSIYTKDYSEGIVSLSAYHSLHCLV